MANHLNEFDRLIKKSYENHQEAYNPEHWEELKEELEVVSPGFSGLMKGISGGVIFTTVLLGAMMLFVSDGPQHGQAMVQPESVPSQSIGDSVGMDTADAAISTDEPGQDKTADTVASLATETNEAVSEENDSAVAIKGKTQKTTTDKSTSNRAKTKPTPTLEPVNASVAPSMKDETPGVRSGCTGMTIRFNAPQDYANDAKFLWNFGDGYFSNDSDPSHTFNKEGVFDVSLSVTSHSTGQISSNVIQAMIEVAEAPSADFRLTIIDGNRLKVTNDSYGATHVDWILDGTDLPDRQEVTISLVDNTRHELSLTAYNHTGCSDTLTKAVYVSEADNRFPKAYSASYASGFAPGAIIDGGEVLDFRIYRTDTDVEVFRSAGSKGWLGNDNAGKSLKPGDYKWVMLVDNKDSIQVYLGNVELRK